LPRNAAAAVLHEPINHAAHGRGAAMAMDFNAVCRTPAGYNFFALCPAPTAERDLPDWQFVQPFSADG
jgi:hypothetical protein